ncbi:transcriptional regulator, CarD family [Thermaerobacter marianensis DSM 12885]|uniref:Transcriptional regulator, CarD family n=1 Tax=Thermaerobacter marianensis (strain ATCC 700841 / DSM 12885 / JCM 10246 / 7p75a) TaxID=644966 RepID=E6SLF4_THEM7|nr:transcriptional regulator, CarD family [Thermaerobacter marianensis DSM 12885]
MFEVGDRVVYPMHGAGVIEAIEEREVLGKRHRYYVLRLPVGDMRVMIPTTTASRCGLRPVIPAEQVPAVLDALGDPAPPMDPNWNHRYREHADKLRTGDVLEVAAVVRNLSARQRERGLSGGERRLLDQARQILVSELTLASGLDQAAVDALVDRCLEGGAGDGPGPFPERGEASPGGGKAAGPAGSSGL